MRAISRAMAIAVLLTSSITYAADPPTDPAGAESLFDEGRKLMDAGKFADACPKLEASNRLDPAVGTLLNLGECNEKRGKLASAWSSYRQASSLAQSRNDARAEFAKKRAAALESKLSTLTIDVLAPEPGLKVTRDGLDVGEGAWGTAIPIDAGTHVIEAKAPGKRTNLVKLTVSEGAPSTNVVKLEALAVDSGAGTTDPTTPSKPTSTVSQTPTPQQDASESHTGQVVGVVGMGVGVIAIGAGAILALRAKSTWDGAKTTHCNAQVLCDTVGLQANTDARNEGTAATIFISAGIAVGLAGVAAFIFWPHGEGSASAKQSAVRVHGAGFDF